MGDAANAPEGMRPRVADAVVDRVGVLVAALEDLMNARIAGDDSDDALQRVVQAARSADMAVAAARAVRDATADPRPQQE